MKGIIWKLTAGLCLLFTFAGCSGTDNDRANSERARIHISISPEEEITRSSYDVEDNGNAENLLVLFYTENGKLAAWISELGTNVTDRYYSTGELILDRDYYIYALAGIEIPDNISGTFGTIAQAQEFAVTGNDIKEFNAIPYSYIPVSTVRLEKDDEYEIPLKRCLARISFMVDCSDLEGTFTVSSLNIRQSPQCMCPLSSACSALSPYELEDGDSATPDDILAMNNGSRVTYYLLENLQGEANPGNSDPWQKVPERMSDDKGALATYVEITGQYQSEGIIINNLTYRFFLGDDTISNCDVRRNTAQTVTLILSDENAVLRESWKVTRGKVEDSRNLSFENNSIEIFPYPGRMDAVALSLYPNDLSYRITTGGNVPFDVSADGNNIIIESKRFLTASDTAIIFPVCVSTVDNALRDTLNVVYYSLDGIEPLVPNMLFTNFSGYVSSEDGEEEIELFHRTPTARQGGRFGVRLNYNGRIKSTLTAQDTIYENGLDVSSSDRGVISSALSGTNPTLWYLEAGSIGTARITAGYSMDGITESGYKDIPTHTLGILLNADSEIRVGESCHPSISLTDECGTEYCPDKDRTQFKSSNKSVLTDSGIGSGIGSAVYQAIYDTGGFFEDLSDSKEITVSESADTYELYISPVSQEPIHPGESCRDTAWLRHYYNGTLMGQSRVSCTWSISDTGIASMSGTGYSVTVTGVAASSSPAILTASYTSGDGRTYTARKSIYVSAWQLSVNKLNLSWLSNENGATYGQTVNITATPSLAWTAALGGGDMNEFTLSATSGTGSSSVSVWPKFKNTFPDIAREATLTISATGVPDQTVELVQMRDSILRLYISPDEATLDLNAEAGIPDVKFSLYGDWLSGRTGTSIPAPSAIWTSTNPNVARHTGNGTVAPFSAGYADITATYRSCSATARVNVLDTRRFDTTYVVRITPSARQTIESGGKVSYTATAQMLVDMVPVGNPVNVTNVASWISTEPSVASVSNGIATGHNSGSFQATTLICASYLGYESNYAELSVKGSGSPQHTLTISTSCSSYSLNLSPYTGESITVYYDGTALPQNAGITWNISDSHVISGINSLKPEIVGSGTCNVSATYNGITSNTIEYDISSSISSIRLEIRRYRLEENGMASEFNMGWLPESFANIGKSIYSNGESGNWITISGGNYSNTVVTIEVAVYGRMVGGGAERLLDSDTFSFSAKRGNRLTLTPADWQNGAICNKYFTFNAIISVE